MKASRAVLGAALPARAVATVTGAVSAGTVSAGAVATGAVVAGAVCALTVLAPAAAAAATVATGTATVTATGTATVTAAALGAATGTAPARGVATATGARVAHPLGNFTVNHYNGLRIGRNLVENLAVVDSAELPTLQARPSVDTDRSGTVSDSERSAYGTARCAELAAAQRLTVNGTATPWRVAESSFTYEPGQGGLETTRLTCRLSAVAAPLQGAGAISFGDGHLADRIGWREITAVAEGGVRLARSSVPGTSVSEELRAYPDGLLSSPLDQRAAELGVAPGTGSVAVTLPLVPDGPVADALAALDRTFVGLVGTDSPTLPLGLLAVLLATVLGAGHALIPGHGKTVMAAYLAGRRGRPRDALIVGATVTATHTLGVVVVGLLLSAFSVLTGEGVLAWLGLASGLLILAVGVRLLLSAWRAYRTGDPPAFGHGHGHFGHGHGHGHFGHGHGHGRPAGEGRTVALLEREGTDLGEEARSRTGGMEARDAGAAPAGPRKAAPSKGGLVGMGVAGGLVPSPSALVVLLGAIALGRTWFGIALVLAYGVGMAGTLTATGLLLVRLTGRLDRLAAAGGGLAARVSAFAPVGTAALVVLLGLGLALRGLTGSL